MVSRANGTPAVDVTPTPTSRTLWPPNRKVSRLRGDNRSLHARQKLLRLGQRQPQIGYVAGPTRPADLHYVYASTLLGMPVSINRNTQRIDDPQVNISRSVISMPAKSHQFLDTPGS